MEEKGRIKMEWRFFQKEDLYWIQEVSKDFLKESAWGNRVKINKEKSYKLFLCNNEQT